MTHDPRDVYVSDLVRFIAAFAADLPEDKRRTLMRRFLPWHWERQPDGRAKLLIFGFDDIGASDSSNPLIDGASTSSARGLLGTSGSLYQESDELEREPDGSYTGKLSRREDSPWIGPAELHAYLLRLHDAGILL